MLYQRSMPSSSANEAWVRTMSRMDTTGNVDPYAEPVRGSIVDGPVDPWQPPMTLAHTTK